MASGIDYHFSHINYLREVVKRSQEDRTANVRDVFGFESLTTIGFPFIANDPRDKVYALLPLASLRYGLSLPFHADYGASVAECYTRLAMTQITESQSLKALTCAPDMSVKTTPDLPSWVPDYGRSAAMPLRREFRRCVALDHLGETPRFTKSQNWRQLRIKGVLVDVVAQMAAHRSLTTGPRKCELDTSWFDLLASIRPGSHNDKSPQPTAEVLWRTLCIDTGVDTKVSGDSPAPSSYGGMFRRFVCALVCNGPEISARNEERAQQRAFEVACMLQSIELGDAAVDEAFKSRLRAVQPPTRRTLDSPHFDCSRSVVTQLETLRRAGNEDSIPSTEEIAEYFASGEEPLREHSSTVFLTPGCEPFLNSLNQVYGARRLFATRGGLLGLGPCSAEPGDEVWLVPGFSEVMILRKTTRQPTPVRPSKYQTQKSTIRWWESRTCIRPFSATG